MKNLHLFKRIAVMIMAAMMVIPSFALPTFAAADTQVTIKGVESGATVTLYKVVKEVSGKWVLQDDTKPVGEDVAKATEDGVTTETVKGIKTTTKGSAVTVEVVPSADKIAAIAKNTTGLPSFTTYEENGEYKSYLADGDDGNKKLEPGVYVAVVTGTSGDTIYNPMVVSMDYNAGNGSEVVDANSRFGSTAYAKKSTPEMKKTTLDAENRYETPNKNENLFVSGFDTPANDRNAGTDKSGSVIDYKVVATIPSYADTFTNPRFFFKDALQDGFKGYVKYDSSNEIKVYEEDPTATDGYKELVEGTDYHFVKVTNAGIDKSSSNKEDDSYSVEDKKAFALEFEVAKNKAARKICIVYKAKLVEYDATKTDGQNADAGYRAGVDPYTNEAYIEWSKNPNSEDQYGKDEDCTHHYTFDIDGSIGGNGTGKEIIKVAVDADGKLVVAEKEVKEKWTPLEGAVFAIYKANDDMTAKSNDTAVQTVSTEADGTMDFRGLDAGKYVIQEKTPPTGYALNETLIPVEITPTFKTISHHGNNCNVLDKYTVTINKTYTNTYTAVYDDDGNLTGVTKANNADSITPNAERTADVQDNPGFTAGIVNTTTGTLPSTGGIGTVIFTVGGIAIMALALLLLFGGKKKEEQK